MKKFERIKGFVLNKKTGHPSYAYWQNQKRVKSLGFTHNKNDIADKQKLKYNINSSDISDCYVKTNVEKQRYNDYRYKNNYGGYRIHKDDKQLIRNIIDNDKCVNKKRGR